MLIGITMIIVLVGTKMPGHSDLNDERFIPAMTKVSMLVPQNDTLVTSENFGKMVYFSKNKMIIPYSATNETSLFNYMVNRNLSYLLVTENFSRVHALKQLFSNDGLDDLKTDFEKIGYFPTDTYEFHLYRIDKNSSFHS